MMEGNHNQQEKRERESIFKAKMMKPNVLYRIFLLQCKHYLKKINK